MNVAQTDTTQTNDSNDEPSDAELVAASLEAGGADAVDVDREAEEAAAKLATDAAPKPGTAGEAASETAATEPKIAAVLRAREKAFAERQAADDYATQRRQKADEEAARVLAEARQKAAEDYESDLAARRARFRESPTQAIRELGIPTDDMVDAVTREGTPEWKAMRQMQQELAEAKAKAGIAEQVKADFTQFKTQLQQERAAATRASVEQQFLAVHASPDKAPFLHRRYDPEEIIEKAHRKAAEWAEAGIPFAHSDVAEYLEHQARERLAGVSNSPQQVGGASGNAPKVKANGSRTLSAAAGSERRASPKPVADMTPDEERDALIAEAREVRRTLKADT